MVIKINEMIYWFREGILVWTPAAGVAKQAGAAEIHHCELRAPVITATVERKLSTQMFPTSSSPADHRGQPQFQDWLKNSKKNKPKQNIHHNKPNKVINWGEHLRAIKLLP